MPSWKCHVFVYRPEIDTDLLENNGPTGILFSHFESWALIMIDCSDWLKLLCLTHVLEISPHTPSCPVTSQRYWNTRHGRGQHHVSFISIVLIGQRPLFSICQAELIFLVLSYCQKEESECDHERPWVFDAIKGSAPDSWNVVAFSDLFGCTASLSTRIGFVS